MRPPTSGTAATSALAILHPTTKYAAVQAIELGLAAPGAARLAGPWLWRLPPASSAASSRAALRRLVGMQALLVPLARASSFERLLHEISSLEPLPTDCRWSLSISVHGQRVRFRRMHRSSRMHCGHTARARAARSSPVDSYTHARPHARPPARTLRRASPGMLAPPTTCARWRSGCRARRLPWLYVP